jgi:hypothetical protein
MRADGNEMRTGKADVTAGQICANQPAAWTGLAGSG